MTIEDLKTKTTAWLISFVRANKPMLEHGLPVDRELVLWASEEIKRRNHEGFKNGKFSHY